MYNFMEASAEERSAERERQRRALAALPRTTTVSTFLANRAVALLDLQLRIEDTLLVLKNTAVAPANTPECRSVIQHLRAALPLISAEMGTHVVAARYDIESAAEALHQDEDLPGVAVPFLKAARSAYKQREEAAAKAQAELQRLQMRRRIQANAAATAITAASQAAGPAAAASTAAAAGSGGAVYPRPVAAGNNNKYRFPCDACGVKGHWKAEGVCKPEDLANYAALLNNAQYTVAPPTTYPALPAPPGTSGTV
jgi:hypothetical protein